MVHLTAVFIRSWVTRGNNNNPRSKAPANNVLSSDVINQAMKARNALSASNKNEFNNAPPNKIGNAPRIRSVIAPNNNNFAPSSMNLLNNIKPKIPINVNRLMINDAANVARSERTNGIAMLMNFNAKKLKVVIGSNSKKPIPPTINGNARIAPISTIALRTSKTSLSNLNGRTTRATNTNASLLNKFNPGRIVHSGNVRSVAPILNKSRATCAKPLMNVHPHNRTDVNN